MKKQYFFKYINPSVVKDREAKDILNEVYLILENFEAGVKLIENIKSIVPMLQAMNFDFGTIIRWWDSGVSVSQIYSHMTDYAKDKIYSKFRLKFTTSLSLDELIRINIYKDKAPSLDFIFLDTLIEQSNNPFEKMYFRICNEIMKVYADPNSNYVSRYLTRVFGDVLNIKDINRPLPFTKISRLIGMSSQYFENLIKRYEKYLSGEQKNEPYIQFNSFAKKIEPSLVRVLGANFAHEAIQDHLGEKGYRYQMFYSLYLLLYEKIHTDKIFTVEEFSEIFFGKPAQVMGLIKTDPLKKDLDTLWMLEYQVSKMKDRESRNKELGFAPKAETLKEIIFEAKKIIRAEFTRQTKGISPIAVNMILDSLYALSEKRGFLDFNAFSELTTYNFYGEYLSAQIFGKERNPPNKYADAIRRVLAREGLDSEHMAVQWTELYLQTKGFKYLDFEFFIDKFKLLSGDRVSDEAIVRSGTPEHHMALTITYLMTGGRSWMTGELIDFDKALLHHILHDASGTLYGVDYENKYQYFACLDDSKGENQKVEKRSKQQYWEDKFIYMWQQFKAGNYKEATEHWNDLDPQNQKDFLRERRSSRYLDKWLGDL